MAQASALPWSRAWPRVTDVSYIRGPASPCLASDQHKRAMTPTVTAIEETTAGMRYRSGLIARIGSERVQKTRKPTERKGVEECAR